ncbi:MAG: SusE domain-containing protein [Alistipes sp.]|nr:SusE domain-containing protein [Alistipes sp.]
MKFIKYLSLFVAAAVACVSCETGIEKEQLLPAEEVQALVLAEQSDIVINADNIQKDSHESISFTCTKANFGVPVQVSYKLYFKTESAETLAAESTRNIFTIDKQTINGLVVNQLGVAANEAADVSAYVVAYAGESDLCTPQSNLITFNVQTFKAALRNYYICGAFVGGWKIDQAVEIWETAGGSNIYEGMYNFTDQGDGNSGFKVMPNRAWDGGEKGYDYFENDGQFSSSSDGNLQLPAGIWQVSIDLGKKTIAAKGYSQVDIMGSFDGWANPMLMNYDYASNCWVSASTVNGGDEYKIRMNGGWSESYGGGVTVSDSIPTGFVIEGGDNIRVPGSGQFYVELHADRTPWVVTYKAAE